MSTLPPLSSAIAVRCQEIRKIRYELAVCVQETVIHLQTFVAPLDEIPVCLQEIGKFMQEFGVRLHEIAVRCQERGQS